MRQRPSVEWAVLVALVLCAQLLCAAAQVDLLPDNPSQMWGKCYAQLPHNSMCPRRTDPNQYTGIPAFLTRSTKHTYSSPTEVAGQLAYLHTLLTLPCSHLVQTFFCTAYHPFCNPETGELRGPCRSACEHVRVRCEPFLLFAQEKWPIELGCEQLETQGGCISFPEAALRNDYPPLRDDNEIVTRLQGLNKSYVPQLRPKPPAPTSAAPTGGVGVGTIDEVRAGSSAPVPMGSRGASLCGEKRQPSKYVFVNRTGRCAPLCNESVLYSPAQKQAANVWLAALAAIALLCSAAALLTFAVSEPGVKFPQRPVEFVAFCNLLVGAALAVRMAVGRTHASCMHEPLTGASIVAQEGVELIECTLVFMLSYLGASASALWCVVLIFCFLLATSWGRTHVEVREFASYFHLVAWCVPALLTTVVVVFRLVDADELFGLCSVGLQSTDTLLYFQIVPAAVCLFVGVGFLLTCLWNAVGGSPLKRASPSPAQTPPTSTQTQTANNYYQQRVRQSARLSKLRFCVFVVLAFLVPLSATLVLHIYEYVQRDSWTRAGDASAPVAELLFLRTALQLLPSVACGVWLISRDTLDAWRGLCYRVFCRGAPGKSSADGGGSTNRTSGSGATTSSNSGNAGGAGVGSIQYVQLPVELSQNTAIGGGGTNSVATMIGMQTLATQQTCASHSATPSQSVGSGSRTFFADMPHPMAPPPSQQSAAMLAHSPLQHQQQQQLQLSPPQMFYQAPQMLQHPHAHAHQAALMQQQWQFSTDPTSARVPLLQPSTSTGDPSLKSGARTSSSAKRASKLQQMQLPGQAHLYSAGAAAALMQQQQQQQQRVAVIAPTRGPLVSPAECTSMSESYGACGVSIEPYTPPHCNTSNCSSSTEASGADEPLPPQPQPQPKRGGGGAGAGAGGTKNETII